MNKNTQNDPTTRNRLKHRWCPPLRRLRMSVFLLAVCCIALAPVTPTAALGAKIASEGSAETAAADPAIAAYASDYSVTEAEAKRRLDRIDAMSDILRSIRDSESERVAGWGIEHGSALAGWVWLTGSESPSARAAALAAAHVDVEIQVGAPHSLVELLTAQESFGDGSSVGPVGRVTTGPDALVDFSRTITFTAVDMRTNALQIGIDPALASELPIGPSGSTGGPPTEGTSPIGDEEIAGGGSTDGELRVAITQMTADLSGHVAVAYEVVDGRNIADDAMFDGGRAMVTCTSGFAARQNGTNVWGIITAGHCTGATSMHGVSLPWVYGYPSVAADAEFRRVPTGSGHQLRSQFAYGDQAPLTIRVVTSKADRVDMAGRFLCHQGKSSGVSCGTVTNIHYRPTHATACRVAGDYGDPTTCHNVFVRVHGPNLQGCNGDSGGPWFISSKAYGIHKSSNSENDCTRRGVYATFSALDEVEDFLGVTVMVANNVTIG